jgi:hypothetical protein
MGTALTVPVAVGIASAATALFVRVHTAARIPIRVRVSLGTHAPRREMMNR